MAALTDMAQALASAVVNVTHDDLTGLAAIHTQLQDLREALPADMADSATARETSSDCERLVEQIILREVADTEAAVVELNDIITALITILPSTETFETPIEFPELPPTVEKRATSGRAVSFCTRADSSHHQRRSAQSRRPAADHRVCDGSLRPHRKSRDCAAAT